MGVVLFSLCRVIILWRLIIFEGLLAFHFNGGSWQCMLPTATALSAIRQFSTYTTQHHQILSCLSPPVLSVFIAWPFTFHFVWTLRLSWDNLDIPPPATALTLLKSNSHKHVTKQKYILTWYMIRIYISTMLSVV